MHVFDRSERTSALSSQKRTEVSRFFGGRSVLPLCHLRHERKYHVSLAVGAFFRSVISVTNGSITFLWRSERSSALSSPSRTEVSRFFGGRSVLPLCHLRHERKYHVSLAVGAFVRSVISVTNVSITFLWRSERSSALAFPSRTEVSRFFGRSERASAFSSSKRDRSLANRCPFGTCVRFIISGMLGTFPCLRPITGRTYISTSLASLPEVSRLLASLCMRK